jgi:hypothetical protein
VLHITRPPVDHTLLIGKNHQSYTPPLIKAPSFLYRSTHTSISKGSPSRDCNNHSPPHRTNTFDGRHLDGRRQSRRILKLSTSKVNFTLAKSKRDAKFTESASVTENRENMPRTPSSTSSDGELPSHVKRDSTAEPTPQKVAQPKSRKIVSLKREFSAESTHQKPLSDRRPESRKIVPPKAGGMNKVLCNKIEDGEPRRKTGDSGVAVSSRNPVLVEKYGNAKEARRLWWEQTDASAHRWGVSDASEENMEWVTQHYPKTHWKTRKALAEKEAMEEMDSDGAESAEDDEHADHEKDLRAARKKRRV